MLISISHSQAALTDVFSSLAMPIGSGAAAVEVLAPLFSQSAPSTLRRSRKSLARSATDVDQRYE